MILYDACICYPHTSLSVRVARALYYKLTNYSFPKRKSVELNYKKPKIYLFSQDDMNKPCITEEHKAILSECGSLILICTPETRVSPLLNEMLTFFEKLGYWNRIIPVLTKDLPANSFPALLFRERVTVMTDELGENREYREYIEPLAADIRASSVSKSLKMIPYATHKVIAVLLSCSYDDIVQRAIKRTHKKQLTYAIGLLTLLLAISIGIISLWIRARIAEDNAKKQTQIAVNVMDDIFLNLPQKFQKDPDAVENINDFLLDNMEELINLKPRSLALLQINRYLEGKSYDTVTDLSRKASLARQLGDVNTAKELYTNIGKNLTVLEYDAASAEYSEVSELFLNCKEYSFCAFLVDVSVNDGGLLAGDILVEINGEAFQGDKDFLNKLGILDNETATITILRQESGELKQEMISLDKLPENVTYLGI